MGWFWLALIGAFLVVAYVAYIKHLDRKIKVIDGKIRVLDMTLGRSTNGY